MRNKPLPPKGYVLVYQCLMCSCHYGHDARLPDLPKVDGNTEHRYLDSTTWRCPKCGTHQDTRDIHPFLGCGGNRMLRQLTEEDIQFELLGFRPLFGMSEHEWRQLT